jgi:hypothetical protein
MDYSYFNCALLSLYSFNIKPFFLILISFMILLLYGGGHRLRLLERKLKSFTIFYSI